MARLYYTDPIIAAYMDKYHDVKFSSTDDMGIHSWHIELNMPGEKYYIAKESESIFDPKEDDKGYDPVSRINYEFGNDGFWKYNGGRNQKPHNRLGIIMRDDKHFFMCEEEK
jgi:hypothetical protein